MNNFRVHHNPRRQTNSNIFVEEPDVFIIPGQRKKRPPRANTPDSPPLKPPVPLTLDKTPPPIPPKTYVKVQIESKAEAKDTEVTSDTAPVEEVEVQTEPKQSNIERAKIVRFHPDVKIPIEGDPPPIPVRGQTRNSPTVAIAKETVTTAKDTTTIAKEIVAVTEKSVTNSDRSSSLAVPADIDTTEGSEGASDVVIIVDANGEQVGELVPSPVMEMSPSLQLPPTPLCQASCPSASTEDTAD